MSGGIAWITLRKANTRKKAAQLPSKIRSTSRGKIPVKCPSNNNGTIGVNNLVSKRLKQKASLK